MKFPLPQVYRAQILDVHDGDTIKVRIDRGFEEYSDKWIRLACVYAPELRQRGGSDARQFVQTWLTEHDDGSEWPYRVTIHRLPKDSQEASTFNRYVGTLTTDDGVALNQQIVEYVDQKDYPLGTGVK